MKRDYFAILLVLIFSASAWADTTITGTIRIEGDSVSSVVAGKYKRLGAELTTKPAVLATAKEHAKAYDGPTTFDLKYEIVLKGDKTLKSGTVILDTKTWTSHGMKRTTSFTTPKLTVAKITMDGDKVGSIEFKASGDPGWYPEDANGASGLAKRDLTASVDLKTKKYSSTASYSSKTSGAVYTYKVTGKVAPAPTEDSPTAEVGEAESKPEAGRPHAKQEPEVASSADTH